MRPFRFIHAADLHLDSPFRGLQPLPPAVRGRIRRSTYTALDHLVGLALRERVDFVLVAGDVYDAADRSLRAQLRFQKAASRLAEAGIAVFVLHGNHDPDDGRAARLNWPDAVRFFSPSAVGCFPVCKEGEVVAHVYGISFGSAAVRDNLAAQFAVREGAPYHIAMLHANVDGDPAHDNYAPCSLRELVQGRFDYWALGHIHTRSVLHEAPYVVYPGNLQGRSIRETGAKGCYLVDVDGRGAAALRFCPLDDVRWQQLEVDIAGMEAEQQLLDAIRRELERLRAEADGRAAVVRLTLTGRGPMHAALRGGAALQELTAELQEGEEQLAGEEAPFVWIESVRAQTGSPVDREAMLTEAGFLGDLLRLSEELLAGDAELATFAEEALAPLKANPRLSRLLAAAGEKEWRNWLRAAQELAVDHLAADPEGGG